VAVSSQKKPEDGTICGFYYYVTDEQLDAFSRLTPLQKLQWVEEARQFTLMGKTPETAQWHKLLRQGKPIR
jgi:hypothetical protein